MSVTGESLSETGSGSFWEVGQYKRTVRRIEDGNRLCNDLMTLIHERSEIEKAYAKSLRHWSKKWNDLITKGPEYGTTEAAWKSVLNEADRVAQIHTNMRDELMNEVHADVKRWQKENYHKPMVGPLKEIKDMEDAFKKVQKPWAKKLDRVVKCKKDYHLACRTEKSAKNQENNAKSDSSISDDQRKKLEDKVQKLSNDVTSTRERYQAALQDINSYNAKYMEEMTEVFDQCQVMERKRLTFVQQTFHAVHKGLDLSAVSEVQDIYRDFLNTIENADSSKDLKWWSNVYGADMAMNWPVFEEFSPELTQINKKHSKKDPVTSGDGITLTGIYHQRGDSNLSNSSLDPPAPAAPTYSPQISDDSTTNVSSAPPPAAMPTANRSDLSLSYDRDLNPFADDDGNETLNETNPFASDTDGTTANNHADASFSVPEEKSPDTSLNPFGDDDDDDNDDNDSGDCSREVTLEANNKDNAREHIPPAVSSSDQLSVVQPARTSNMEDRPVEPAAPADNPFTEDWDEADNTLVDNGAPGVPVVALYDYERAEADELSFKAGDEFEKLEDEDEQGWCKGRIDGRVGLYPANYCQVK